jgi:hypothetical protein
VAPRVSAAAVAACRRCSRLALVLTRDVSSRAGRCGACHDMAWPGLALPCIWCVPPWPPWPRSSCARPCVCSSFSPSPVLPPLLPLDALASMALCCCCCMCAAAAMLLLLWLCMCYCSACAAAPSML